MMAAYGGVTLGDLIRRLKQPPFDCIEKQIPTPTSRGIVISRYLLRVIKGPPPKKYKADLPGIGDGALLDWHVLRRIIRNLGLAMDEVGYLDWIDDDEDAAEQEEVERAAVDLGDPRKN
jgi:hypothetical protein